MARRIWSGSIGFGPVSVLVKAYPAARDHAVHCTHIDLDEVDPMQALQASLGAARAGGGRELPGRVASLSGELVAGELVADGKGASAATGGRGRKSA